MLSIVLSNRFKKDLKRAKKRGLDLDLLEEVVDSEHPRSLHRDTGIFRHHLRQIFPEEHHRPAVREDEAQWAAVPAAFEIMRGYLL